MAAGGRLAGSGGVLGREDEGRVASGQWITAPKGGEFEHKALVKRVSYSIRSAGQDPPAVG